MQSAFNRYEQKFLIPIDQIDHIKEQIGPYVTQDDNASLSHYTICNIYYDTTNDEIIKRSVSKPMFKEKLRLRCYGEPKQGDIMFLEIKKKLNGFVNKRRTSISYEDACMLIHEKVMPIKKSYHNSQVLNEIYFYVKNKQLIPRISLSYDREAYYAIDDESIRLTFDYNMTSRRDNVNLGRTHEDTLIVQDERAILEVKTTGALPLWLTNILTANQIYPNSFSKYGTEFYHYLSHTERVTTNV